MADSQPPNFKVVNPVNIEVSSSLNDQAKSHQPSAISLSPPFIIFASSIFASALY
jgi:hypothetical protein